LFALASLLVVASTSSAQAPYQGAPIEHRYANAPAQAPRITSSQPIAGVYLRVAPGGSVQTISASEDVTELRVVRGRASVGVDHPASNIQILVDLPGGQTAIVKDGLYTFNADTNTVRVFRGEADAFPGAGETAVPMTAEAQYIFGVGGKPGPINRAQSDADLFPGSNGERAYTRNNGDGYYRNNYGSSYYAPYGYSYPYYAYGYPGFYGYPYGYGYPFGVGIGFGYYGGFRGGYGGGFRGGFRGHR
jgi:hypothetical protein